MQLLAAAAFFVLGILAGWWAIVWLLWRVRSLQRSIDALNARLSTLEGPQLLADTPAAARAAPPRTAASSTAPQPTIAAPPPPRPTMAAPTVESPPAVGQPAVSAASAAVRTPEEETLESRIGGQWLLYIGVLAILIGVAYFEKLAFESAWLGETARVIQGAAAGLLLVYGGVRFARAGYAGYGHAISGTGVAALYVSIYASFNFYDLIARTTAFGLMLAVTAAAAALADRERSQGLAMLAVGGGYLTPFLLPGTSDAQVALFGYDAILASGASALATRRTWPLLYATSYLGTVLTIAAWADRFYTPAKFLRTELFLTLFCALFAWMLRRCRLRGTAPEQIAWLVLLTSPPAYYVASVAILIGHATAFLVWIVALAAAGAALAIRRSAFGLAIGLAVLAPLLVWCDSPIARAHLVDGLSAVAGVYALGLAAQIRIAHTKDALAGPEIAWLHLNGLGCFAAAYVLLLHDHVALAAPAAAAFAVWHGVLAVTMRAGAAEQALHVGALGFTLMAVAIALEFDGAAVTIGWSAEALAIVALGWRRRRGWLRGAGLALFAIAFVRAISLLTSPPIAGQAALFNRRAACALFVIAVAYGIAWLHERSGARGITTTFVLAAQVITLLWFTSEIRSYWSFPETARTGELVLSVTWAAYATALVVIGLRRRFAPLRIFAIVVLAITIVKVFTVDLAQLQRVYRVASILGLGIMLLLTSYLYQRSRGGTRLGSAGGDGDQSGAAAQ